ncbi:MAG: hypothetical protein EOP56_18840 [Sphingobacteriales bacterium]|nr:MAG: hypothetical protein EOP56_18840 [Sphingobacteriales bacterium]
MKNLNYYSFILFLFLFASCKDIIEQDVTHAKMNVLSPANNLVSNSYDITFWWDKVEGAQKYRLQIVKPAFDSLEKIAVDTLISETKIQYSLFPGRYQWRIRVENGSSSSPFIVRNIKVDTNLVLTGQNFTVDYPLDQTYSGKTVLAFSWQSYPFADIYEYALLDSNNVPIKSKKTSGISITDTIAEGKYNWRVRGINSGNNTTTLFSITRSFYIDITSPSFSTNPEPIDLSSVSNPITLSWLHANDIYADSIIIASDSNFTNTIQRHYIVGSSIALQPLTIGNTYFWKIKSRDKAGNWSAFSPFYRFTITP